MKHTFSVSAVFIYFLYAVLISATLWQVFLLARQLRPGFSPGTDMAMIDVMLEGNVRRPGRYRVARGTTQFEILRVAGVRPTSDLSAFTLSAQIDSSSEFTVGTLEKPVGTGEEPLAVHLEFFFGEISIVKSDGRTMPHHEGLAISSGDRILTEASSQAELSVGAYSRIDMDNFSEIVADKIGSVENDRIIVELFQKAGACWYKMAYIRNSELFRINTVPVTISIGGSGADFLVDAKPDRIVINLMDGLLLVERIGGGEAINMISGQSATIHYDERPFQITKLTPEISVNERFAQLSREKVNYLSRRMPLNIMFCGIPAVFYFINVHYERSVTTIVRLPGELLIEQFANGISTLEQAYLYGGPVMVATFVEHLVDTRIPKYIVFDKSDIIKIAGVMGGVQANIDQNAASHLNLAPGKQKLSDRLLAQYLSPTISGNKDAQRRQSEILRSLFDGIRNKSFIPTLMLADQVISSTETNFGAAEIIDHYKKFSEKANWDYRELDVPAAEVRRNNRTYFDPNLDQCKRLLTAYD